MPVCRYQNEHFTPIIDISNFSCFLRTQKIEICFFEYFHIIHSTVRFAVVSARLLERHFSSTDLQSALLFAQVSAAYFAGGALPNSRHPANLTQESEP